MDKTPWKESSLCWKCKKATCSKEHSCSWSEKFKPVEGWKAQEIIIKGCNGGPIPSYIVIYCPNFIPFERKIKKEYKNKEL